MGVCVFLKKFITFFKKCVLGTEDEFGESNSSFRVERKDKDGGMERVRETDTHHPPIPAKVCGYLWVHILGLFTASSLLIRVTDIQ